MVDRNVAKALVEVSLFLELSDDEAVDPDAAVAAMEQMASNLQEMNDSSRRKLTTEMRSLAADYPPNDQFVRDLPEALGFALE